MAGLDESEPTQGRLLTGWWKSGHWEAIEDDA